ncbi:MAG TPA: hypothetical protein PKG56_02275 [Chitinophagaceae bacterium]|nr:hypothetical protein [Chitinophagaceae bacterium]HMZ45785.1 hypothetical protein [Chitinophagaceae bacterium]HNE93714.1 hypothetical protein [Chitinophagaceae bacterium]HNF29239.1 hypothetical protein [Chitinophagaceae bacterium]HNL82193.1 hypothetical protein [Chitinophagaceae bacterium]
MKKGIKILLSTLAITLFTLSVNAQTEWVSQKIGNKIIAKFPTAPIEVQAGAVYSLTDADSTNFTATFVDLEAMGLDSATLAGLVETEEFSEQFKTGLTSQMPGVEVTKSDITKWNDLVAYNIEGTNASKKEKVTFKCIFWGSKMFTFICTYRDSVGPKNKDIYINSLALIK